MKGNFKKVLSIIVSVCMVICGLPSMAITAMAAPSATGLFAGKYGKAQIFDCQRSPAYPTAGVSFTARGFKNIYNDVGGGQFPATIWGDNSDRYVQFYDTEVGGGDVGLKLYEANGDFVQTISVSGNVWGLGDDGFLYVSTNHDYGYFVSNLQGYSYYADDPNNSTVTYTTTTGKVTDTSILSAYNATTTALEVGQTADDLVSTYTVTFDPNNGGDVTTVTGVLSEATITEPEEPTYEGYTFEGWYTDSDCTTPWDFDNDVVTDDITLYADWEIDNGAILIDDNASIEQSNTTRNIAVAPNGNIYVVYQAADGIYVKYSTDNGETFSEATRVCSTEYEAEIAASSNGYVYVSWVDNNAAIHVSRADSSDGSLSFAETVSPGDSAALNSTVHMATDGEYLYIVNTTGQYFYYSDDSGETYSSDACDDVEGGDGLYVFSDVHVNTYTHQIVVQKDKPRLTYYISDDYAQSFKVYRNYFESPDVASDHSVYYSVGSLASGSDESFLYIAGGNGAGMTSSTVKINLTDGKITSGLDTNPSLMMQGRSLSSDSYGNVIAGYTDALSNGKVCFQVSNDYGNTFGDEVVVDAGYISNAAINSTNGDVMFLYQDVSGHNDVYFVVYSGLLSGYDLELNTSSVYLDDDHNTYTVEVTNNSGGGITIEDIKLSAGDNFNIVSVTDEGGNDLEDDDIIDSGDTIYINVEFVPSEIGVLSDTLTIDYSGDGGTGTRVITLSGTADSVPAPMAPENLAATAGNESVKLTWGAVTTATTYSAYLVSTSVEEGTTYTLVAEDITDTSYTVRGLTNGTIYSYVVRAVNSGGSSDYSNVASATPEVGTTYSLTLKAGEGTINSGNTVSYVSGKETVLPTDVTLEGATFGGWYEDGDFSGERVYSISDVVTGNKSYSALWLYDFSGTISSDSENENSYIVKSVYLVQDDNKINATAFDNDSYSFEEVPEGQYNLVMEVTVTIDGIDTDIIITKLINVNGATSGNIVLPKGLFTSKVTVVGEDTPDVEVGGLDELATAVGGSGSETVEIELKVQENPDSSNAGAVNDKIVASGKTVAIMLDVDLTKTVTPEGTASTTTNIRNLADVDNAPEIISVIFHLPPELQGKNGYVIYRYHDGEVQVLTKTPNQYGEYIVVNAARTQITAYLNKFSTYAVASSNTNAVTLDAKGGSISTTNVNTTCGSAVGTLPTPSRSHYSFAGWYTAATGGTLVTAASTETESTDHTLYAQWNKKSSSDDLLVTSSYNVTVSKPEHGSISPSGTLSVIKGSSKTFTITPDEGYVISDVLIDDESVGAVSSYTLSDVSQKHTVEVVFKAKDQTDVGADDVSGVPYYVDEDGNKIFIGFAAENDGKMNYTKPDGATILFQKNSKKFTDISSHWAKESIDFVTERELFMGTSTNIFSPNKGMTRAMFATVIGRLYERSYEKIADFDTNTFSDCDYDGYYGVYVDWCARSGIISGVGGGKFEPNREISRQEMATILYRLASFLDITPSDADTALSYSDASMISDWAKSAALYCQTTDIISGRSSGAFVPNGTATRAEVAAVIERFIKDAINQ